MTHIYRVLLDGQLHAETENEIAAWATYRSLLRRGDLRAERPMALIECDGEKLHSAPCDGFASAINIGALATPNMILKALMAQSGRTDADIKRAIHDTGYPVSNSRVQGWLTAQTNRKHQVMTLDELYIVVTGWQNDEAASTPLNRDVRK